MTTQGDLFHLDRALTPAERRQLHVRTRSKKRGHAAPPGTGPEGETCGSCAHIVRAGSSKRIYMKCGLMRAVWTHGPGTDIRARDLACGKWERPE